MTTFTICLPTYNEKENINALIPRLLKIFEQNQLSGNILVIDDNSPDQTAEVVKNWAEKDSRVQLLFRTTKEGLGKAYIAGFNQLLQQDNKPDLIFEMDADHSHDPDVIPLMVKMIENEGKEFVVGSRKIKGGGNPDWPITRRFISSGANFYTRTLLRLKIHDVTSGYRVFRSTLLDKLELDKINASGYAFQIEMAYIIEKLLHAEVGEVPIIFIDRKVGKSKLGTKDVFEFWIHIIKLFFFGYRRKKLIKKEIA